MSPLCGPAVIQPDDTQWLQAKQAATAYVS